MCKNRLADGHPSPRWVVQFTPNSHQKKPLVPFALKAEEDVCANESIVPYYSSVLRFSFFRKSPSIYQTYLHNRWPNFNHNFINNNYWKCYYIFQKSSAFIFNRLAHTNLELSLQKFTLTKYLYLTNRWSNLYQNCTKIKPSFIRKMYIGSTALPTTR